MEMAYSNWNLNVSMGISSVYSFLLYSFVRLADEFHSYSAWYDYCEGKKWSDHFVVAAKWKEQNNSNIIETACVR